MGIVYRCEKYSRAGFTLVEVVVGVAIFLLVALALYQAFFSAMRVADSSQDKVTAIALANEQMEIIRNLTYENVGVSGAIPSGSLQHIQTVIRDNTEFTVTTVVRNIDDPFDGQIGNIPNDLSPADYRLVEITIDCALCNNFSPLSFTTHVGPRGLETASTNGALFIHVFDADGQPVQGADVHVENNLEVPPIVIDETTNNDGYLQIIDAPPGVDAYEVSVSKPGYSSDQSYPPGAVGNPNPTRPHTTVLTQQLSLTSFSIDETSTLNVRSMTDLCVPVGGIDFGLTGSKLIGTGPDVIKFSDTYTTNGAGSRTISDVEWDTYNLSYTDGAYNLSGTIPTLPLTVNPGTDQDVSLIVTPWDPRVLLVTVKDTGTQLPLSGASVRLQHGGYDETLITGRGYLTQTDWSGGSGQASFTNPTEYFSDDGSIETLNPAGELHLRDVFGVYAASGELESSTFDTGTSSNFHQILWQPQAQPPAVGDPNVRVQVATNNDNATWNFLGPDGTSGTYYDLANQDINALHDGDRYLRYKIFMQTADTTWTPVVSDVSFTFTSSCTPPGQVAFTGLGNNTYTITVTKAGYQDYNGTIPVSSDSQQEDILLLP